MRKDSFFPKVLGFFWAYEILLGRQVWVKLHSGATVADTFRSRPSLNCATRHFGANQIYDKGHLGNCTSKWPISYVV